MAVFLTMQWRSRWLQIKRAAAVYPLRQRQMCDVQRRAEAYFRALPDFDALLSALASSISTGVSWSDYWLLHRYVIQRRPARVLEFGSGKTTLVIAHALAYVHQLNPGRAPGHLFSMEDGLQFHQNIRDIFPDVLRPYVTLLHSPTRASCWRGEIRGCRYDELPSGPFDFVFVDGPDTGESQPPKGSMTEVSLDLLYLLERDWTVQCDVVVDYRYPSLEVYQSVLPWRAVRFDPVMFVGVLPRVSGLMLGRQRPSFVTHGNAWRLLSLSKASTGEVEEIVGKRESMESSVQ